MSIISKMHGDTIRRMIPKSTLIMHLKKTATPRVSLILTLIASTLSLNACVIGGFWEIIRCSTLNNLSYNLIT